MTATEKQKELFWVVFSEEVIYRGYAFLRLAHNYGFWVAAWYYANRCR